MATGLEALGAASAILTFITFAGKIVAISYKIYEGNPIDEDELEDYAGRILDASERIRSRNQQLQQVTPAEAKLSEIAGRCVQLAEELQKESQSITRRYQKGKFRRAVSMALRANAHKAKMKGLEQSLERYKKVMETELLFKICDKSTAIEKKQSQVFLQLERDIQDLISNIASGQTKIESLVAEEAQKTREEISTNITTYIKSSEEKAITDSQRQRLLKSLKPAEIRMRYNDVMSPSDASFERVFASFERVCRNDPGYKDWEKIKKRFWIGMQESDESDESDESNEFDEFEESDQADQSYQSHQSNQSNQSNESHQSNQSDEFNESDESDESGQSHQSDQSDQFDDVANVVDAVDVVSIDCAWRSFSAWLQSDDPLFWIQGKPGSGKSTLMKFIIENDNTECLLRSWRPNARIISYFLWKIGQESQNSIKGLLCCLLHDLLSDDCEALDDVLEQFSFCKSKDFYQEWSSEEAEKVLSFLLNSEFYSTCIFIDGLDEISDKCGFESLIRVLQRIWEIPRVKVCVSSRLETGLVKRLEAKVSQKLLLHDLTRPEMAVYIQKQLAEVSAGLMSASSLRYIINLLLEKAEGVFLWLFLATNSLVTGIENDDDGKTLIKRLEELPSELEALYEAMWSRLNSNNKVYRETAAMYFHCIIHNGWRSNLDIQFGRSLGTPTLAQVSMVVKADDDQMFPPTVNDRCIYELRKLCDATERELRTRCAGMLQISKKSVYDNGYGEADPTTEIYPFTRSVEFIHRTAHDFLVDTKPGQDILSYYSGMETMIDFRLKLFKSDLHLSTIYHTVGVKAIVEIALRFCIELQNRGVSDDVKLQLLEVIQNQWNKGVFVPKHDMKSGSFRSLPARLACELTNMEDFCLSWMLQSRSSEAATVALRDICFEWKVEKKKGPPIRMIQRLLELDADPHAVGATSPPLRKASFVGACFTQEVSAFELLLRGTLNRFIRGDRHVLPAIIEIIDGMAPLCPDFWRRRIIVHFTVDIFGGLMGDRELQSWEYLSASNGWATFEVNMQYLLKRLLAAIASCGIPTQPYKVHEITNSTVESYSRIRNIGPEQTYGENPVFCYRVINQEPWQSLCDHMFGPKATTRLDVRRVIDGQFRKKPKYDFLLGSYKRVLLDDEIDILASEGLGFYRVVSGDQFEYIGME